MHELSIAEGIIKVIQEATKENKINLVKKVTLEIGELSSVEAESIAFCFDLVCKNTVCENSKLEIIRIPGKAKCKSCGDIFPINNLYSSCASCDSVSLEILQGRETLIKNLEVE